MSPQLTHMVWKVARKLYLKSLAAVYDYTYTFQSSITALVSDLTMPFNFSGRYFKSSFLSFPIKTRSTIGSNILFNLFFDNFEQKGTILQKHRLLV